MTKRREIQIHLGFWVLFIGMNFLFNILNPSDSLPKLWLNLHFIGFSLIQILIFYLNYSWICPKTIPHKKWGLLLGGQILLLFLFPTFRHIIEEVIIYKITGIHNYHEDSRLTQYYFYDNTFYAIRIILISLVFYFVKTVWNNNKRINELQLEKKQAELQNLKNQLSPHFLFNTLNSFYADLMDVQPKMADDILKLSDMLRYVTYETESDYVSLKDEIQFIKNYIDLFSRRFDNQLSIYFQHSEVDSLQQIPSLLLIHFVENALKHGITTDADKPINIQLKTIDKRLLFSVENYFKMSESYDETGIGYKNIRQRLELLFPENHTLKIEKSTDFYKVELNIPLL